MVIERPIIFSGAMVRAILEDRKTQTRRVVVPRQTTPKVPPVKMWPWIVDGEVQRYDDGRPLWVGLHPEYPNGQKWFACDYGQPGDRLWVRETWAPFSLTNPRVRVVYQADMKSYGIADLIDLEGVTPNVKMFSVDVYPGQVKQWKPSIHMPRWASRITLEITGVRVERLQSISELDCEAELGAMPYSLGNDAYNRFRAVWDSINARRGYSWDSNLWVWVLEFRRI